MKTAELTGAALDWAVANIEGVPTAEFIALQKLPDTDYMWKYFYSTDWAQGGPIIEREKLSVWHEGGGEWHAKTHKWADAMQYGDTPLIAAMRCYVASKLGDEVGVPTELTSYP